MTLPLALTTVTVVRPEVGDPSESLAETAVGTFPAQVSGVSGTGTLSKESVDAKVYFNPTVDVRVLDKLTDTVTGDRWTVKWTRTRVGLGLDYRVCGVDSIVGTA